MKRLMVAALVASMFTATIAMADSDKHGHRRDRDDRHDSRRGDDHRHNDKHWDRHDEYRRDQHSAYRHDHRYYDHHQHGRYRVARYYPPKGYHPHAWYRGARLPAAYYAPRYVVYDYGSYHLHRPPYGYHWVRVDNDVVMAAIATGVVLTVVHDIFH